MNLQQLREAFAAIDERRVFWRGGREMTDAEQHLDELCRRFHNSDAPIYADMNADGRFVGVIIENRSE